MGGAAPIVMLVVFIAGILLDSGHESQVILLPDADGTVGVVEVSSGSGQVVLNSAGQMTKVSGSSAPSAPVVLSQEGIEKQFSAVFAAEPSPPAKFLLYFEPDSNRLVADSQLQLPKIIAAVEERLSYAIGVYGHADRTGSEEHNLLLSMQRALAVRDLLSAQGVDAQHIDVDSHGEGNPLIPTADGVAEPLNRRVEVIVR